MAKHKTNQDGYQAVMEYLEAKGEKHPKAALARLMGVSRQHVHDWKGIVPEGAALRVSILTGIPIETIRPETVAQAIKRKKELR